MGAETKKMARRNLDKRLSLLTISKKALARPSRGWIKAIRESLGMTTRQFARRLGVSQPRVVALEKAEATGGITLKSLERAARALDCRLVYALVPRRPLEARVTERAIDVAKRLIESTSHSMALEGQAVTKEDEEEQIKRLARSLAEKSDSRLWQEP